MQESTTRSLSSLSSIILYYPPLKLLALLRNRKPSTISVHKLRRTNLQLWQGSSRLSRCSQGRARGRQQQALRHQIRAAVPCAAPRSSSGTDTPHSCRSQVSQVRNHQHQTPALISHRAALTGCSQMRFVSDAHRVHTASSNQRSARRNSHKEDLRLPERVDRRRTRPPSRRSRQASHIVFSRKCAKKKQAR